MRVNNKIFYSAKEIASFFSRGGAVPTRQTIYQWVKKDYFPKDSVKKIGREYFFSKVKIDEMLDQFL